MVVRYLIDVTKNISCKKNKERIKGWMDHLPSPSRLTPWWISAYIFRAQVGSEAIQEVLFNSINVNSQQYISDRQFSVLPHA